PHDGPTQEEMAQEMGLSAEDIAQRTEELREFNPMLGHRGCRLGITYPEITEMQTQAIIEAAIIVGRKGIVAIPEVMVPLVGTVMELRMQKDLIVRTAEEVMRSKKTRITYKIGTMIEVPRAALTAGEIAECADFFSFGTNDLTQMTFGYSRDDSASFLPLYISNGILQNDPFKVLDRDGVGQLVRLAKESGRKVNPKLKVGICGEHGGEPRSVAFFHEIGLDYVSCSPFRVPIARLAAAHAALKGR
ncbi:MAG: pyruvate, phosphate dikinase, partial [Candidatus Thermoplasmatota archaeon]|nr:pyruvate, phosphate dikinase [Candidatus Thermoplasmatota archaeon]